MLFKIKLPVDEPTIVPSKYGIKLPLQEITLNDKLYWVDQNNKLLNIYLTQVGIYKNGKKIKIIKRK